MSGQKTRPMGAALNSMGRAGGSSEIVETEK